MAEIVTKSYDIDISKTGAHPIVRLSQYDTGSVRVGFTVYDGSELANIDGCTARVDGTRSDGAEFSVPCDVSSGSKVSFIVISTMTKSFGKHDAELVIMGGTSVLGTQNFILDVERATMRRAAAATADDRTLYDQYTSSMTSKVNAAITDCQTKTAAAVASAKSQMDSLMAAGVQKKISATLNSGTDYTLTIPS